MNRNDIVRFRLSADTKERLAAIAAAQGYSLSEFMRLGAQVAALGGVEAGVRLAQDLTATRNAISTLITVFEPAQRDASMLLAMHEVQRLRRRLDVVLRYMTGAALSLRASASGLTGA